MNGQIIQQVVLSREDYENLIEKIDLLTEFVSGSGKPKDEMLTTKQAMELLKCGETTIWKWKNEEGLPFHKIGGKIYFSKNELSEWMNKR